MLGGTIVFGLLARVVAGQIDASWTAGPVDGTGRRRGWASDWVIVPTHLAGWVAPVTYIGLVALALVLTLLHGWTRIVLLVPTLYLAAFVWENVMLAAAGVDALHRARRDPRRADDRRGPQGLLGEKRVEIV